MSRVLSAITLLAGVGIAAPAAATTLAEHLELAQETGDAAEAEAEAETTGRAFDMEINFRSRYAVVPDSIIDTWYFRDDEGLQFDRPLIKGTAFGLEFVTKKDNANGVFYFEYLGANMDEGYWDDREDPPDHLDGEYLRPTPNLGVMSFGADYYYESFFVRTAQTNGVFGLSFVVGGGLGVGVVVGEIESWEQENGVPAYERVQNGQEADGPMSEVPPVIPMVDINAGLRFNFGDRAVLRVEGGLHTMLYFGGALGIMF